MKPVIILNKIRNEFRGLYERYNTWRDRPLLARLSEVGVFEVTELVNLGRQILNVRGQHYGIKSILSRKCDVLNGLKLSVEHGAYLSADVLEIDIKRVLRESPSCLVTFGDFRAARIKKWARSSGQNFLCAKVGPYIAYADSFYPELEAQRLKSDLGRMLLVFPAHGWEGANAQYDHEAFITKIKEVAFSFDCVCISVYWHDFLLGKHHPYEKEGWVIVCAGHRSDPYFLHRLRSLIELADMTMSNSVGTHVGYCVSLGKQHYIFDQALCYGDGRLDAYEPESVLGEIVGAFNQISDVISEKQAALVENYWGKFGEVEFFKSGG